MLQTVQHIVYVVKKIFSSFFFLVTKVTPGELESRLEVVSEESS